MKKMKRNMKMMTVKAVKLKTVTLMWIHSLPMDQTLIVILVKVHLDLGI